MLFAGNGFDHSLDIAGRADRAGLSARPYGRPLDNQGTHGLEFSIIHFDEQVPFRIESSRRVCVLLTLLTNFLLIANVESL